MDQRADVGSGLSTAEESLMRQVKKTANACPLRSRRPNGSLCEALGVVLSGEACCSLALRIAR